ncbi:hypothetical protein CORC01_06344 [Colletotrichum orchidophilum]|uniref:Uncharacterized protein n=1 Tax=Colletotrichum orchidophilum TaxID=1209926 RepID=A0A1G4BAE4_9PEZI|nr:uncharacterized protein CORC01_06344 [Colletotrichum orchidophilum]OHE98348.1 hypothetical protein CORC01_06344 [Colletotrichum orchidophilum]
MLHSPAVARGSILFPRENSAVPRQGATGGNPQQQQRPHAHTPTRLTDINIAPTFPFPVLFCPSHAQQSLVGPVLCVQSSPVPEVSTDIGECRCISLPPTSRHRRRRLRQTTTTATDRQQQHHPPTDDPGKSSPPNIDIDIDIDNRPHDNPDPSILPFGFLLFFIGLLVFPTL